MSKESTALGAAIERLVGSGHTVELIVKPGHGQNRSTAHVVGEDGSVRAKLSCSDLADLAERMTVASRDGKVVSPSATTIEVLDYLVLQGVGARFAALDAIGELIVDTEMDTPVFKRQRAAAIRIGRQFGAAALYDRQTGSVSPIEGLA